jgi:hypothetical protein
MVPPMRTGAPARPRRGCLRTVGRAARTKGAWNCWLCPAHWRALESAKRCPARIVKETIDILWRSSQRCVVRIARAALA